MSILLELADRIEASSNPDRGIDVAIVRALHPDIGRYAPHCKGEEAIFWEDPYRKQPAPMFTSSIDDAIKLVPEGFHFCICADGRPGFANVHKLEGGEGPTNFSTAATPPMAVCAAALRAHDALSHLRTEPAQALEPDNG